MTYYSKMDGGYLWENKNIKFFPLFIKLLMSSMTCSWINKRLLENNLRLPAFLSQPERGKIDLFSFFKFCVCIRSPKFHEHRKFNINSERKWLEMERWVETTNSQKRKKKISKKGKILYRSAWSTSSRPLPPSMLMPSFKFYCSFLC